MSAGGEAFLDSHGTYIQPVALTAHTALLVVDMQIHDARPDGAFNVAMERLQPGSMAYFNDRTERVVVPAIGRLLQAWRTRDRPVVHLRLGSQYPDYRDFPPNYRAWIKAIEDASGVREIFYAGSPDFQIRPELAPVDGEWVVDKLTYGAFNSSNLDRVARAAGFTGFVVAGISTNCCVESTVRGAAERGYECVVVDEATADYDESAHLASLRALAVNHARVVRSVDEVLAAVDSGTPM
ncbi:cysteine hydrolase family protein [Mycolicibacterium confluentis]|uniref:N-carbamoylsarcosine amidase n=1 Tax=Mycolicibacterium confluentis TaxID=28047 RepID=A0A7I7XX73_9MYCO|nr:isochorismatase family cysteine hydrolase [Mycolicibacterium confluentis]MCV7318532.1 cysteine hydrolase [Mycolicibacterium confluentis]ORV23813.1 hypothetical protein AWB99_23580 [Mycolicibacterium confluentis]BBZ33926.1 N-carbamoylsarcosine amidase [Mycolicibacterium confluentis]